MNVESIMCFLIKGTIFDKKHTVDIANFGTEELNELYSLSNKHDVAHLVAEALREFDFETLGEEGAKLRVKLEKQRLLAVFRYEKIRFALAQLCELFEAEGVDFMPLKGSVIRKYYPEEWMRTSCDIDVLVREEQLDRAAELVESRLGFKSEGGRNYHDVSFISPGGVHLELHFSLLENSEKLNRNLSKVWDFSCRQGNSYQYKMTNEYFLFHIVAHAAYHFTRGGCGVRQLIDLHILLKEITFDEKILEQLCGECGIWSFYCKLKKLCEIWFGEDEHDETTTVMSDYILKAGAYGTIENSAAVSQSKGQSKLGYVMSRLFVSYDRLKEQYPVLKKHKWLMPFMQVRRWFRVFRKGKLRASAREVKASTNVSDEKINQVSQMLNNLGL